jgi:hypothetical protein
MERFGFALLAAALVGCGKENGLVPVGGVVLLDGKPLANAAVMFHASAGQSAYAITDRNGAFQLTTREPGDGVHPGDQRITVSLTIQEGGVQPNAARLEDYTKPIAPKKLAHIVPQIYNDPKTSPLSIVVAKPVRELKVEIHSALGREERPAGVLGSAVSPRG